MKANLSIWGMYQYNNTLFNDMSIPTQVDRQTLIDNILLECNEMQILYTNWSFLKSALNAWSAKSVANWQRIADALDLEYNPIENYDRQESWVDTQRHTGTVTDQSTSSGSSTREDTTEDSAHLVKESSSSLAHDGDSTETISGRVETDSTFIHDEDRAGTESHTKTGSTSLHHIGEDTVDETAGETDSNSNVNSVNGFNGTLSDSTMSPHDKSVYSGTIDKTLDHDGTNEYTDTGSSSDTGSVSTTGTTDFTDTTDQAVVTTGNNSATNDYTDTYSDDEESTDTRSGSLESEETHQDTGSNTRTNNLVDTFEHSGRVHGNIGVLTSTKMVTDEIDARLKYNIYDIITKDFKKTFCLSVYF